MHIQLARKIAETCAFTVVSGNFQMVRQIFFVRLTLAIRFQDQ